MAPTRPSRAGIKKPSTRGSKSGKNRTPVARSGGLSRELAGLNSWYYWKVSESESSDEDEGYESDSLFLSESEQDVTEVSNETEGGENPLDPESDTAHTVSRRASNTPETTAHQHFSEDFEDVELAAALNIDLAKISRDEQSENDTIMVSTQSEATFPASVQSLDPSSLEHIESEQDNTALAGPRCPLCICPINGVYFATIQCEDCDRIYHQSCIGYEQCEKYHPFYGKSIAGAKWCEGCGCPDGHVLDVYVGHPSVLFHRRDQDPGFKEYFRQGRLEEAKWEDLG